jgi:hypothetical protein
VVVSDQLRARAVLLWETVLGSRGIGKWASQRTGLDCVTKNPLGRNSGSQGGDYENGRLPMLRRVDR